MTIVDAARKVLREYEKGLPIQEIYDLIVAQNLYTFGAQDPVDVLRVQIERHCVDTNIGSKVSGVKFFIKERAEDNVIRYRLCCATSESRTYKQFPYIKTAVNDIDIYTFIMTVADLSNISYVAVRGKDREEGSVQRVLNKQRIASIKRYVLDGNMFVNTFVLNWTNEEQPPILDANFIEFPICFDSAQLIDGQHRLEGLKAAASDDVTILNNEVIVSMAINLPTIDAAKIFLNINSEQKPVPRSLIYDLYGVTGEDRNYAINRANDIAQIFHESVDSPYYRAIKFPGAPRGVGKLDLSTVVSAIKKYVEKDGKFEEKNIRDLQLQSNILLNYFNALKYHADKTSKWSTISLNIFYKAAGFIGAIEFFFEYVFPRCVQNKCFKQEFISSMFDFSEVELITPKDIISTDGRTARKRVEDNLKAAFNSDTPAESDYAV